MSENPSTAREPLERGAATSAAVSPPAAEPPSAFETPSSGAKPPAAVPSRSASPVIWPLFVVAVIALGLLGWQWYDSREQLLTVREELARRLAEGDLRNKEAQAMALEARQTVRELTTRLEVVEGGLAESQHQQVALEALYQQLSRSGDEWALAEIEQILTIAAQQLQLAGNVRAAILALESADARLQRIDRPQLAPLRKVIERDLERLRVAPHVDVVGLTLKLDQLIGAVDALTLAMEQRPPPSAPVAPMVGEDSMIMRFAREIWQDLRSLVRIQTIDRPEVPLLDPGQAFFLRENLKLRLLSARVALLQRDERTFRADLGTAARWLERYFDENDPNRAATLAALRQLGATSIGVELPDIAPTIAAVRDYKLTRERALR